MTENTGDWVLIEAGWRYWPRCPVAKCTNRVCLRLASSYCWPHTPSNYAPEDEVYVIAEHEECHH